MRTKDGETGTKKLIIAVSSFEKAAKWDEKDYSNTFTAVKFILVSF
jgi:hypothetical protein